MVLMLTCAPLDRGSRTARENLLVEAIPPSLALEHDTLPRSRFRVKEQGKIEYWCKIDRVFLTIAWPVSRTGLILHLVNPMVQHQPTAKPGLRQFAHRRLSSPPPRICKEWTSWASVRPTAQVNALRVHIPSNLGQPTLFG